jgi:hypothetical protein
MAAGLHENVQGANSSTSVPKEGTRVKVQRLLTNSALAVIFGAFALAASFPAYAGPITVNWTDWTSSQYASTSSTTGNAVGNLGSIYVDYTGETLGLSNSTWAPSLGLSNHGFYPGSGGSGVWNPSTSWTNLGATQNIADAPPTSYNSVAMNGGTGANVETISFYSNCAPSLGSCPDPSPVWITDPVVAIWSLGSPGTPAEYIFNSAEPFVILAGGPDAQFGGGSITDTATNAGCGAYTVCGEEGNGVIEFLGTFDEISFTTPDSEDYYAFTVGEGVTPEPETLSLLGLGLLALPLLRSAVARRRRG